MVMPLVKTYLTIFIVVLALLCPNAFSATQTGLPIYAPILLDDFGTGELTAWRIFYTNADGNMTELELGANGTYLRSSGVDQIPGFSTPSGAGDVVGPAANTDNYVPQWDGADSKALKDGFEITDAGKALLDDANASVQRTTLGALAQADADSEAELETLLADVTDVFTDNDGALNDDNVTLADVQAACSNDFHNIGGTDDDVPDAGDFGAGTDLDANGAVAWGNITEGELADNTTIGDDIKADTLDSKHYAAGSIDDEHLASGINATKIGDGSITNEEYQRLDGLSEDISTSLDARCLESVFGTGISTGLLLDGTDLKVSTILQEYHGVDPTTAGLALLDDANSTVQRTTLGLGSSDNVTFNKVSITDSIELSHVSDNTLTAASGVLSIEGTALVKASSEVNSAGTIADSVTVTGWVLGASTATTPAANDADTSLATTAFCETTQDYLKTSEKDDVDAIPDDDNSSEGPQTDDINAGESVTAFNVVYLHSDGEWHNIDASATATSKGMLAISLESKGDGEAMNVALSGSFIRHDTWAWTVGGDLYLSETAGEITQTAPTTTDSATRIIGHATHADRIYFNPDNIYVIHE
jgi:hypothetical protein